MLKHLADEKHRKIIDVQWTDRKNYASKDFVQDFFYNAHNFH